ncbi:metallophosphoesterase [Sulfurimonas sp. HSL1-6]|uniref:metallophosphoesterase n=1 Tax=Thiomicrolovo immobilis TaxID=3131935 RepID=UPI0031F8EEA2
MQMLHYCIIGDVHGYYDKLMRLIAQLPKEAQLVFVGDLIDRGPDSAKVIAFVREGGHLCVRGNHETFMLSQRPENGRRWEADDAYLLWMQNGGDATLASYGLHNYPSLRQEGSSPLLAPFFRDIAWLKTLPYYLELEGCSVAGRRVVVSHASVSRIWPKRLSDREAFNRDVLINRDPPAPLPGIYNVFGHTPFRTPKLYDYAARIDTGPYLYGTLSALEVPSLKLFGST